MRYRDRLSWYGTWLLLVALFASPAAAHPALTTSNSFVGGFFHSITGLDHALAMIGVGILSTKLLRTDILLLPLTFLISLTIGAGLGYAGFPLYRSEILIAGSCIALGVFLLWPRVQQFRRILFIITAGFGVIHGYAHLIELPSGFGPPEFTLGFLSSSAVMHLSGVFIGEAFKGTEYRWLMQVIAISMIAFGMLFLTRSIQA